MREGCSEQCCLQLQPPAPCGPLTHVYHIEVEQYAHHNEMNTCTFQSCSGDKKERLVRLCQKEVVQASGGL